MSDQCHAPVRAKFPPTVGELVHSYTRAQAINDGFLIDVSDVAIEAGFKAPVAITRAVYSDCVEWTEQDSIRQKCSQKEAERLWDVVLMAYLGAVRSPKASTFEYHIFRVPRDGASRMPSRISLKVAVHGGDAGEAVFTISQPSEG